jgi:succinate dehydrogenase flavin-adding protein (antitoxin of CptAB toxin-antitoxin module)
MDKLTKNSNYLATIDESNLNQFTSLLKEIIEKQNEIIDWINNQG